MTKLTAQAAGTFAIAPTPFHDDGRIDEKSIDRLTDFYAEVGCDGVTVSQFNGQASGQTVFHLHFHVIPRWSDRPLGRPQTVCHALDVGPVRQVGREHLGAHPCRRVELAGQAVQPLLVAGVQDDVVPCRGQLPGELQAQARARSRDECCPHGGQRTCPPRVGTAE